MVWDPDVLRPRFRYQRDPHHGTQTVPTTTTPTESLQRKLTRLAAQWKAETGHLSLAAGRAMHPAYQRIIGIGPDAIGFLLRELQRTPDDWFWALNAITEVEPVPDGCQGNLREMADAWIKWGQAEGYLE